MLRRKVAESLTARIFWMTTLILLLAGAMTFSLIAWATPSTYTAVVSDDLARQVDELVDELANTALQECGPVLEKFLHASGAQAMLVGPDGQIAGTGQWFTVEQAAAGEDAVTGTSAGESTVTYYTRSTAEDTVSVTASEQAALAAEVRFADQPGPYALYVTPRVEAENLAVRALAQMAPWLLLTLLAFSLICALIYSRTITRPIVRLSGIAEKMARLDFGWACKERRRDEIGALGRSLDAMAKRLSTALEELKEANLTLQREVERERELDRQRTAFFSAASHELKTPVTILKGQLSGMLDGVGAYRDRDKYLLRSLQVAGRMERLIGEMLAISRMETGSAEVRRERVDLSALLDRRLMQDDEMFRLRGQRLISDLTPGVSVAGDEAMLEKVVGCLLSNAALYSPEGAQVRVWCGRLESRPSFTVENSGAQISADALPHLFEPFYRAESSRSRATGGSGLGLYLVKMILERHGAECRLENTAEGVRATVTFPAEGSVDRL